MCVKHDDETIALGGKCFAKHPPPVTGPGAPRPTHPNGPILPMASEGICKGPHIHSKLRIARDERARNLAREARQPVEAVKPGREHERREVRIRHARLPTARS